MTKLNVCSSLWRDSKLFQRNEISCLSCRLFYCRYMLLLLIFFKIWYFWHILIWSRSFPVKLVHMSSSFYCISWSLGFLYCLISDSVPILIPYHKHQISLLLQTVWLQRCRNIWRIVSIYYLFTKCLSYYYYCFYTIVICFISQLLHIASEEKPQIPRRVQWLTSVTYTAVYAKFSK